jgi:hypothetical protein
MRQVLFFVMLALISTIAITPTIYAVGLKTKTTDNFSFQYPSNWKLDKSSKYGTFVASVSKGSDAAVKFELNDDGTFSGTPDEILSTMQGGIDQMYADFGESGTDTKDSGTDKYTINNQSAPYVIFTFTKSNLFGFKNRIVDMMVTVDVGNGNKVIAQYMSDEDNFDKYLPTVEQIIGSLTPNGNGTSSSSNHDNGNDRLYKQDPA